MNFFCNVLGCVVVIVVVFSCLERGFAKGRWEVSFLSELVDNLWYRVIDFIFNVFLKLLYLYEKVIRIYFLVFIKFVNIEGI